MKYLTGEQRKEIILMCGDSALILYEYYVNKGSVPDFAFSDTKSGRALGWTVAKTQRIRLILEKAGYLRRVKDGNVVLTYIGKDSVSKSYQ